MKGSYPMRKEAAEHPAVRDKVKDITASSQCVAHCTPRTSQALERESRAKILQLPRLQPKLVDEGRKSNYVEEQPIGHMIGSHTEHLSTASSRGSIRQIKVHTSSSVGQKDVTRGHVQASNNVKPVTREEIDDFRSRIDSQFEEYLARLDAKLDAKFDALMALIMRTKRRSKTSRSSSRSRSRSTSIASNYSKDAPTAPKDPVPASEIPTSSINVVDISTNDAPVAPVVNPKDSVTMNVEEIIDENKEMPPSNKTLKFLLYDIISAASRMKLKKWFSTEVLPELRKSIDVVPPIRSVWDKYVDLLVVQLSRPSSDIKLTLNAPFIESLTSTEKLEFMEIHWKLPMYAHLYWLSLVCMAEIVFAFNWFDSYVRCVFIFDPGGEEKKIFPWFEIRRLGLN